MKNINVKKINKIHIIINPAAGKIEPILPVINTVMMDANIDWEVFVTKKPHDACTIAKEAIKQKIDAVAVYGGDGTVMEAINGMMGSDIALAILPGGTANVLATELGIPKDLKEACQLVCEDTYHIRTIDVGQFNRRHFILRLGLGFEAEMVKGADRQIKNRFGKLAYVLSSAEAFKKIKEVHYHLKIDGKAYEASGITCIIANSGNIGFPDLSFDNHINVSDGLLDVVIVRKVTFSLLAHIIKVLRHQNPNNVELVQHWQCRDIHVSATPEQICQCDGEVLDKMFIHAKIIPAAFRVIVPNFDNS